MSLFVLLNEVRCDRKETIRSMKGSEGAKQLTSTGSEVFSLLLCLDAAKYVFLIILTLIETNCEKILQKSLPNNSKRPLPVDLRRSEMSLLELPNICMHVTMCLDPYNVHAFNIGPLITCI